MSGAGIAACLVTIVTMPVVLVTMRRLAAIDLVNERSSHQVPTPRGGGISVALGVSAGVLVLVLSSGRASAPDVLPMMAAVTLFGLIGLAEDTGGITPFRRLGLQALASLTMSMLVLIGGVLDTVSVPGLSLLVAAVVGPLWISAFVNAFNFMDGVNGISATQALVAGGAFVVGGEIHDTATLTAGGVVLVGTALGFAPFNFPHARIFLGDVGSYALGAAIAVLALQGLVSGIPLEAVLAPLLLYLADTGSTLLRRLRRGEPWYYPHRTHVYQRLTDVGWTHTRVTLTVGALLVALSGLGLLASRAPTAGRIGADAIIGGLLLAYLVAPGLISRRGVGAEHDPRSRWATATDVPPVPGQRLSSVATERDHDTAGPPSVLK